MKKEQPKAEAKPKTKKYVGIEFERFVELDKFFMKLPYEITAKIKELSGQMIQLEVPVNGDTSKQ